MSVPLHAFTMFDGWYGMVCFCLHHSGFSLQYFFRTVQAPLDTFCLLQDTFTLSWNNEDNSITIEVPVSQLSNYFLASGNWGLCTKIAVIPICLLKLKACTSIMSWFLDLKSMRRRPESKFHSFGKIQQWLSENNKKKNPITLLLGEQFLLGISFFLLSYIHQSFQCDYKKSNYYPPQLSCNISFSNKVLNSSL